MTHGKIVGIMILFCSFALPSYCACRYSRQHRQEPQSLAWFNPYAIAKIALLGSGISWAAWKIYKYFVFTIDDARQVCGSLEVYVQEVHKHYELELKLSGDDVIVIKNELHKIIVERGGRMPYFSYVNRLNKEVEQCKEQLNNVDVFLSRAHELTCKMRADLRCATDPRVIVGLEDQVFYADQAETKLRELKVELSRLRQSFEMLSRLAVQFPEYEHDRYCMRFNT